MLLKIEICVLFNSCAAGPRIEFWSSSNLNLLCRADVSLSATPFSIYFHATNSDSEWYKEFCCRRKSIDPEIKASFYSSHNAINTRRMHSHWTLLQAVRIFTQIRGRNCHKNQLQIGQTFTVLSGYLALSSLWIIGCTLCVACYKVSKCKILNVTTFNRTIFWLACRSNAKSISDSNRNTRNEWDRQRNSGRNVLAAR